MSEEEKKNLEHIKKRAEFVTKNIMGTNVFTTYDIHCVNILIEIIEKQQKELNTLKEIEQSHQEENGKLKIESEKVYEDNLTLVKELEQEKEKNKELEKQINFNKKTVEIAQTQILEYSQGYKDGLNKETTATAIVARELELNFIRQEIKHKYISKDKIKEMKEFYINEHENKNITLIPLENIIKNINVLLEEK